MEHRIDTVECAAHHRGVAHVTTYELNLGVEVGRAHRVGTMDLRREVVERPDLVSVAEQIIGQMRSDESRATRDQNPHGVGRPFSCRRGVRLAYSRSVVGGQVSSKGGSNRSTCAHPHAAVFR